MILSRAEIRHAIESRSIIVEPAPESGQYSSTSLDLRLGEGFHTWDKEKMTRLSQAGIDYSLDASRNENFSDLADEFLVPLETDVEGCLIIRPGEFVLGITHEWVELPLAAGIAARVEGRSTLARMGLAVHLTAPTIHAGWEGKITLEMVNLGCWPIKLRPRELRICQLVFERVGEVPDSEGDSDSRPQFQGQQSPAG